ncbi:MAG: hypothetical protein S4CHLAM7_13090 [Chlamydiae bacterium]|nr:hypothetical protein [Chlamydiota bacterium]
MTPNVTAMPSPGTAQSAGTFSNVFINPPIIPPVSDNRGTIVSALLDQLAGFQISLFQHLFPVPQNPNYQTTTFGQVGSTQQMQAVLIDVNNIKSTVLAINQITNTPANRVPAGASNNTNPGYAFLNNSVINACNNIANDVLLSQSLQAAQADYTTLQGLLNPIYGF